MMLAVSFCFPSNTERPCDGPRVSPCVSQRVLPPACGDRERRTSWRIATGHATYIRVNYGSLSAPDRVDRLLSLSRHGAR